MCDAELLISMEDDCSVDFDVLKLPEFVAKGLLGFDAWTSLISNIEKTYPDDIKKICLVYDSFLSEFPLCYGYWRKYADHKSHLCTVDKVIEVYERAVQSATYSVGLWVDYCSFSMSVFEDPFDVRRLFKRGLSFVGKDYLCHTLWDKYIEFELSQQQWSFLAHVYILTLRFPTKKLHHYYDSFKKLVAICQEEIESHGNSGMEVQSELVVDSENTTYYKDDEVSHITTDLLDPSVGSDRYKALQKYLSIGEQLYQKACQVDAKIHGFETHIRRPYFHVKPLDVSQLENWHQYLDFVEVQGDFDWAVKLYERCLIPCANYPEFWMRYVEFMEIKGGREIANFALDRSTKIFLKSIPAIHVFNAWFKEQTGDVFGAHAAFVQYETESDSSFIENVIKEANMKKRLGNFAAASNIFKEALAIAVEKQKFHILPNLYIHFSRLEYMITGSVDAARDILIDGIRCVPESKMLLEELIKFAMMHGGPRHINVVDAVVANAISPGTDVSQGLSAKDGEYISRLYLEFVDLCGTIYDVKKAWNRHIKLFPHCLRTMSIYKYPATSSKPLRIAMEGRPDIIAAMPCHPFGDSGSDRLALIPIEEQGLSCPENHDIHSEQVVNVQLEPEAANKSAQEGLQLVIPKVPGQHREEASEPNVSDSVVKEYNEIESVQALLALSRANDLQQEVEHEPLQDPKSLSLECLSLNPQGKESPESIPASSHEVEAPEEACRSNGIITESVYNTDENPPSSSPVGTSADDPAEIHSESVGPLSSASPQLPTPTEELSQSLVPKSGGGKWNQTDGTDKYAQIQMSPERHKNPLPSEAVPHPQLSVNGAGNWRQMNNADKVHRDSSPRFHGHSRNKRRASRHVPLEQQYPRDQIGTQMLVSQGNPGQPFSWQNQQNQQGSQAQHPIQTAGQGNLTATHAWPMQIVQQQNFASASSCQVPAQPVTQAQVSQYPMQSNEQYGHMQNSQAYNQMWHYYYYQQQQHFIQQQQLQLQQQPQQQQHPQESEQLQQQQLQPSQQPLSQQQQSHQQQLLQQQYQQQHLELQQHYLQQHQQQFQHQQNHQQQLQLQQQQYVLQQQQSYQQQQQQQHLLYLQQLQQQQQEHEPQKQQQQQQLQQKEDQEQQQQQLLITPLQIQQAWNNYQQASLQYYDATSHSGTESNQQIMVPQGQPATPHSTSSSEHAASPGVQQQSPKLMKQTDDNSPINSV